jgi:hypothetical protein
VLGGYALAALGFAYVTLFYVATRALLGWWVPTGTLDDPNQIASPLPWAPALGLATFAGTWEESIFRAVPLALLAIWARGRANRTWWLALGVVVTALVFGFGHANYQSWPAYSRGAELFLEAALWAVLYMRVGLPTTVVAHALYDLTWFGLFSLHGTGTAYRVTFAIVLTAFLLPALAVAQGWLARRRALAAGVALPEPPRLGDWRPADVAHAAAPAEAVELPVGAVRPATHTTTRAAAAVALVALLARLLWPRPTPLGPPFDAAPERVAAAADSAARARGADLAPLRRFVTTDGESYGDVRRFLEQTQGRDAGARTLGALATTYLPASWWQVRYARTAGTVAERAEEWQVRVLPDGRVLDVAHVVPEAQPGASPSPDSARAVARRALDLAGVSRATLREANLEQTPRPARLDTRAEFEDTAAHLGAGATARVRVSLAGDRVLAVRRLVRLPESFDRAERERASRRALIVALAGIGLFALVVGLIVVALRRPLRPDMPRLVDRRVGIALGAGAAVASVGAWANGIPAILAAWPTQTPWSTYLAQAALSAAILAGVTAVVVAALWTLTDALRRRTAIPFWPDPVEGAAGAALRGAALGLGATALQFAAARLGAAGWPVPRSTALGELLPWAGGAIGVIPTALVVPTLGAVGLALAVAARRPAARWAALAAAAVCVAALTAAGDDRPATTAAGAVAAVAAVVALARWFGATSAVSWVFAALAAAATSSLRGALGAETPVDAGSGALGAATALVLGVVLWRAASRRAAG